MHIVSSAPTRIDLAGGTIDIWPLYLFHENAQTLNAAISLRARCVLSPEPGKRIVIAPHQIIVPIRPFQTVTIRVRPQ